MKYILTFLSTAIIVNFFAMQQSVFDDKEITAIAVSHNQRKVAMGLSDGKLKIISKSINNKEFTEIITSSNNSLIAQVVFSPSDKKIAYLRDNDRAYIYDIAKKSDINLGGYQRCLNIKPVNWIDWGLSTIATFAATELLKKAYSYPSDDNIQEMTAYEPVDGKGMIALIGFSLLGIVVARMQPEFNKSQTRHRALEWESDSKLIARGSFFSITHEWKLKNK